MVKFFNNQLIRIKSSDFSLPFRELKHSGDKHLLSVIMLIALATLVANLLSLVFPLTLLQIYDRVVPNNAISTLIILALAVVVALIFETLLRICQTTFNQWLDAKFEYRYGMEIIETITRLPLAIFRKQGVGNYLEKLEQLQKIRNFYAGQALSSILNMPFILVFLLLIAYIGSWVVIAPITMIVLIGFILSRVANTLKNTHQEKLENDSMLSNFTIDTLENIHYIKAQALEEPLLRRYERLYQKKVSLNLQEWKNHALQLTRLMGSQLMIILVAVVGAPLVIHGYLTVGSLAACIILSSRCVQPLNTTAQVWVRLQAVKKAQQTLENTLRLPQETQKLSQRVIAPISITIKNLSLTFKNSIIFERVNLKIHPKECVAIQGKCGSGKTLLLRLLMGELSSTSGDILFNNKNIDMLDIQQLRQSMSYIAKQHTLYHDSILDNLTQYNSGRIKIAKKIAADLGLMTYIEKMPQGLDTKLNEQTLLQMPRGIKQLISIASGLIRAADIILFDEANAYLSIAADKRLIQYLRQLKGKKTIILISERPSLLSLADHCYTISNHTLKEVSRG